MARRQVLKMDRDRFTALELAAVRVAAKAAAAAE
jgi:hypothetical protein